MYFPRTPLCQLILASNFILFLSTKSIRDLMTCDEMHYDYRSSTLNTYRVYVIYINSWSCLYTYCMLYASQMI